MKFKHFAPLFTAKIILTMIKHIPYELELIEKIVKSASGFEGETSQGGCLCVQNVLLKGGTPEIVSTEIFEVGIVSFSTVFKHMALSLEGATKMAKEGITEDQDYTNNPCHYADPLAIQYRFDIPKEQQKEEEWFYERYLYLGFSGFTNRMNVAICANFAVMSKNLLGKHRYELDGIRSFFPKNDLILKLFESVSKNTVPA